jgi:hypothetical protein
VYLNVTNTREYILKPEEEQERLDAEYKGSIDGYEYPDDCDLNW